MSFKTAIAMGLVLSAGAGASAQVRIAEIYGGGGSTTATYQQDYVVLYNAGGAAVDLSGWSVQYASSTGSHTAALKADLTGTIAAGGYFLVQMSSGTGMASIPAPDFANPTNIAMSATVGKVALVESTTALGAGCFANMDPVRDYVGYGTTASCSEGDVDAPAPSTTTSVQRRIEGCFDSDVNGNDFAAATPNPRNSSSPMPVCPASLTDIRLTTSIDCQVEVGVPATLAAEVTNAGSVSTDVEVTFEIPAGVTVNSSVPGGVLMGSTWRVSLGPVAPAAVVPVTLMIVAGGGQVSGVEAEASGAIVDPIPENNLSTAIVFAHDPAKLHRARFSSIVGNANSVIAVPSNPAANFLLSTEAFGRPYLTPDGTRYIMTARTTEAMDNILMSAPVDGSSPPTVLLQEGVTQIASGETMETFDAVSAMNDAGRYVFSGNSSAATSSDDVVVKFDGLSLGVVAREGTMVTDIVASSTSTALDIDPMGRAVFHITGTPASSTDQRILMEDGLGGLTILAQEGVTVPTGQVGGGTGTWVTFVNTDDAQSGLLDNGNLVAVGTLTGTLDAHVVNNAVSVMEGQAIAGGIASTTNAGSDIRGLHSAAVGTKTAASGGGGWVVLDGAVIAQTGDEIFPGAGLHWESFFHVTINGVGDYVIGGFTDSSAAFSDVMYVYNNERIVAREGDLVDLNNDGMANDDAAIGIFRNQRAFLTDDGVFAFMADVRSAATNCTSTTKTGDAFIFVDLEGQLSDCDIADFDGSGTVDATDIFIFLDAWFAQNGMSGPGLSADVDGSGTVDATDIFIYLDFWFAQNGMVC